LVFSFDFYKKYLPQSLDVMTILIYDLDLAGLSLVLVISIGT